MIDRRTLLTRIVAAFSVVGLGGISFPFIRSMMPSFSNEEILDVDVTGMQPGEVKVVRWLGRNVLVLSRSREQVEQLTESAELADPASQLSSQPDYATNLFRSRKPDLLLVYSNCTHLGCEVEPYANSKQAGFRCPCHRSEYDIAGRVEAGAAAKLNLEVPDYDYVGRNVVRLKKT